MRAGLDQEARSSRADEQEESSKNHITAIFSAVQKTRHDSSFRAYEVIRNEAEKCCGEGSTRKATQ